MPLSSQIQVPQDIIDTIIDLLKGDDHTLKSCATVSHEFLQPSRRNLYYTVHLYGPRQVKRLCDLLATRLEIAQLIHELNVGIDAKSSYASVPQWLKEDVTLSSVLEMVPHLQSLSLNSQRWGLRWQHHFSDKLRSTLVDVFQSRSLQVTTVQIIGIYLPLSFPSLGVFTHVKKLCLYLACPGDSIPQLSLMQLEELHLVSDDFECKQDHISVMSTQTSSTFEFPNLRRLSFWHSSCKCGRNTAIVQRIISSARSIERVRWGLKSNELTNNLTTIDLGVVKKLRFLTLDFTEWRASSSASEWTRALGLIVNYLKNPLVTKSLEFLAIRLQASVDVQALSNVVGWDDLDDILVSLQTLQRVVIDIHFWSIRVNPTTAQLQYFMQRLPRLEARGMLSIVSGDLKEEFGGSSAGQDNVSRITIS